MLLINRTTESKLNENLALFVDLLRQEGLPVGTNELLDSLIALRKVEMSNREQFRSALLATLVKRANDRIVFDRLFDYYFAPPEVHQSRAHEAERQHKLRQKKLEQAHDELQFKGEQLQLTAQELEQYSSLPGEQRTRLQDFVKKTEDGNNVEPQFKPILETVIKSHLRYCRSRDLQQRKSSSSSSDSVVSDGAGSGSGTELLRETDIQAISSSDLPAAEQLLQHLSRKLAVQIQRRRRSGPRSSKLDLRRSLRDNMRFGGGIFNLKFKPKRRSRKQVLLLCDVSASMKQYSTFVIHFLFGLREAIHDLSCFSFSDTLENLTPGLKNRVGLNNLLDQVVRKGKSWGGGTNLGTALQTLRCDHGRLLNSKTTILVVSDTKTVSLDYALIELEKLNTQVKRIIWLNPMPVDIWPDYRSVSAVDNLVEMWPCSTIAQLESIAAGRL